MARIRSVAHAFNMGEVDVDNLARVDIDRMRLAAEIQQNIIGTVAGKGFLRPGTTYLGSVDSEVLIKDFIYSADDSALLEFSNGILRVYVGDVLISRASVGTTITNGDFPSLSGWTDTSTAGGSASSNGTELVLNCSATGATSGVRQQVAVAPADIGKEHALTIRVSRGPVSFMVGSAAGYDNLVALTQIDTGTHSLAFVPTGDFWVEFQSGLEMDKAVDSIIVAPAGVMALPTPFPSTSLQSLSFDQSGDVVYIAWGGQQYAVERRSQRSWSVAAYKVDDGPFLGSRTDTNIKLKIQTTRNNSVLSSDKPFFSEAHIGALFYLFNDGQNLDQKLAGDEIFSDALKVTGVGNDRDWSYTIAGTWTGTLYLQRSYDDAEYGFHDVSTYTANGTGVVNDGLDNATVWYRFGFKYGSYTSGVPQITSGYDGNGGYGICRVVAYYDRHSVGVEILRPFTGTSFTADWKEGCWSDRQTWPTGVALAEGRLFWAGNDKWWGSVSDAYKSFDEEAEGDSGPINRTIAVGTVNTVQWMAATRRLIIGTNGAEVVASSSSLDEPMTPSNSTVRSTSTIGSANIQPAKVDGKVIFADRSRTALFEMIFGQNYEYQSTEISRLRARLFMTGIRQLAVQRRPETRVWVVLNDGSAVCFLYEPSQEVAGFFHVTTDGVFESVAVLPEAGNDRVYFVVKRNVGGSDVRYVEKMARDQDARPGTQAFVVDASVSSVSGSPSATIHVGPHLAGKHVKVWADGAPINETANGRKTPRLFLVDGAGNVTLPAAVTAWVAGLPYSGRFKSARLAYGAQSGTSLLARQRVPNVGIMLCDYVRSGVQYGTEFDNPDRPLFPLREEVAGAVPPDVSLSAVEDEEPFAVSDGWALDRRVCIQLDWPASLLALVYDVETNG